MKLFEALKPSSIDKAILSLFCMLATTAAHAQSAGGFTLPGFKELGCKVILWLTSELSIMIFFIVVIVTLIVGFFAKMDWTKILGVIVLLGLLKGTAMLFAGFVTLPCAIGI